MYSRTSWAMKRKKFSTNSGCPVKRLRSSGSCVAMPTGQVLRWQTRIITQPETTSGAVAKPNSSAPSSAAIDDVAPGLQLAVDLDDHAAAQAVQAQHLLRLGEPQLPRHAACLMLVSGDAPVPPSWPEISTTSACALATPAAIVPTPATATSLTEMRAGGFAFFRS